MCPVLVDPGEKVPDPSWSDKEGSLIGGCLSPPILHRFYSIQMISNSMLYFISIAGKSNVAFTFIHWTKHNYARIPYSGAEIGQLTVCTWLDLSYTDEYQPTLLSYSSTTTNDFYISFNSDNLKGIVMAVHVQPYG